MEILQNRINMVNGHFDVGCQEASVIPVMQSFISTLMRGLSAENTNLNYIIPLSSKRVSFACLFSNDDPQQNK